MIKLPDFRKFLRSLSFRKRIIIASVLCVVIAGAIGTAVALHNSGKENVPPPTETQAAPDLIAETPVPETPEPSEPPPIEIPLAVPTEIPTPEPAPIAFRAPLTGLPTDEDITAVRPIAVMINNRKVAQPQLGVGSADIIVEAPVEGGITRMMAIFQSVADVGQIGSIRSARPVYVDLAEAFDAIYIHAGGSEEAYELMQSRNITRLDGVNGSRTQIFFRDSWRQKNMGTEHSLLCTSELIEKYMPTYGFRMEHEEGFTNGLVFDDLASPDPIEINAKTAANISIEFSSSKKTSFIYLPEEKLYKASQFGDDYKDGNTKETLKFTNIIILKTDISVKDSAGRLSIRMTGTGTGTVSCGGVSFDINWKKESHTAAYEFTYTDGSPYKLASGKSYIAIIGNYTVTYE